MPKRKPLRSVRIEIPKGMYEEALSLGKELHGAPSLSRYIITAAMSYTKQFLEERAADITERQRQQQIQSKMGEQNEKTSSPSK